MTATRILHLGKYYAPVRGGIETVVETLCRGERSTVESRALVINKAPRTVHELVDGVAVTRVASVAQVGAVSVVPALPFWLARTTADLIVLHEPNPMALLAYFLVRPAASLIVWYHSEVIRPQWQYKLFYEPLIELALRRAARIVVATPQMLEAAALAPYRAKCILIPYGLEVDRYQPSQAVHTIVGHIRERTLPRLLFVGRLVGYKGLEVLLEALPGVEAETVIIGDGPRRDALEAMARDLGVQNRVRFVGQVSDDELLAWYHASDALVLPSVSRQEAFGMVQLEAMLCGLPVVSTDLPGVSWVNQHERTGLVARSGDAASLHQALVRLVSDPELRRRFGEQARERIREQFTAETMCRATLSLYSDIRSRVAPRVGAEPVQAS